MPTIGTVDETLAQTLPLMGERGYRLLRQRRRFLIAGPIVALIFGDVRGNRVVIERTAVGYRLIRRRSGFIWTMSAGDAWNLTAEALPQAIELSVPRLPWWARITPTPGCVGASFP